jgi:Asp-tRNA(Asn)/Glu-tRNA(Gln) amidotransferase A subunit family amidase
MSFDDYRGYDALGLAGLVANRKASPAELLDAALARCEAVTPQVNAVVSLMRQEAQRVARGPLEGPFAGVPFLLKDLNVLYDGAPTSNGSRFWRGFVADHDSTLTERYRKAGFVVFGKTNTPEMGINAETAPAALGPTRNPWNLAHSAGGSSGGAAAAVAAGIVPLAHATDGGGSIRIPASACGLFGLKPTRGRNPSGPDVGEGWAGMSTAHCVSLSVRDSAALLDATHGPAPGDPYAAPAPVRPFAAEVGADPGRLRIALMPQPPGDPAIHPECVAAARQAAKLCESLGHIVEEARPDYDHAALERSMWTIVCANLRNALELRGQALGRAPAAGDVERATWQAAERGRAVEAVAYVRAVAVLHALSRRLAAFFERFDAILSPTLAAPPLALNAIDQNALDLDDFLTRLTAYIPFTPLYNATGCPAMSVPLHWTADGLPVGVHFGAAYGREDLLLRLAAQLEEAQPWRTRRPPL